MAIIPLAPQLLTGSSDLPEGCDGTGSPSPPIWSCSVWGLPCPPVSPPGRCALTLIPDDPGPHLFTLTAPDRPKAPARRYIFCGTFRTEGVRPLRESAFGPRR